ncbi:MAG TPA: YncE family protein, partial [Terriglobales bacterium]|nr:YncE family protein [Terriglobales bacterium]
FFTLDGHELWVTVRGENYVSVIDPVQMKEVRRIELANGPGMTIFSSDGKYGFVCSSFTPELDVIDVASHQTIKKLTQASPFCPNIAVSPENDEVWITLKDAGKVQIFNAKPPFEEKAVLETGAITNHVNFANNRNGKFAYLTIGGLNEVKVYQRSAKPELVATIPVGSLPHGLWPSGDGSRMYVALENDGMAVAIDTVSNQVIAKIPIGQTTQALVYVPNAVPEGDGTQNLVPLGEAANVARLHLSGTTLFPDAQASVAVNSLGLLDLVQVAAKGLAPKSQYQIYLADSDHPPFGKLEPLALLKTNPDGAGVAQAIGPLKKLAANSEPQVRRFLLVTELNDSSRVVLQQTIQ